MPVWQLRKRRRAAELDLPAAGPLPLIAPAGAVGTVLGRCALLDALGAFAPFSFPTLAKP
jgi:hypothetical protein